MTPISIRFEVMLASQECLNCFGKEWTPYCLHLASPIEGI
jgi:hypothetical protein